MNIFHLDTDPRTCAEYHCDKHVCKMVVETTQMLCTAFQRYNGRDERLYKMGFKNHPMTLWVGNSWKHYEWTIQLLYFLLQEYKKRYGKIHKSTKEFEILTSIDYFPKMSCLMPCYYEIPPLCMPDKYKNNHDFIKAYRDYYIGDKSYFAKWNFTQTPSWYARGLRYAG